MPGNTEVLILPSGGAKTRREVSLTGSADNEAIQAAIDAWPSNLSGRIEFQGGTVYLRNSIDLKGKAITLEGNGAKLINEGGADVAVTQNVVEGDTLIHVANASLFEVGDGVWLYEGINGGNNGDNSAVRTVTAKSDAEDTVTLNAAAGAAFTVANNARLFHHFAYVKSSQAVAGVRIKDFLCDGNAANVRPAIGRYPVPMISTTNMTRSRVVGCDFINSRVVGLVLTADNLADDCAFEDFDGTGALLDEAIHFTVTNGAIARVPRFKDCKSLNYGALRFCMANYDDQVLGAVFIDCPVGIHTGDNNFNKGLQIFGTVYKVDPAVITTGIAVKAGLGQCTVAFSQIDGARIGIQSVGGGGLEPGQTMILNNRMQNILWRGIDLEGGQSGAGKVAIVGNQIQAHGSPQSQSVGILVASANDVVLGVNQAHGFWHDEWIWGSVPKLVRVGNKFGNSTVEQGGIPDTGNWIG